MLRISRGPCRAPGRLVVPPSQGTPTRAMSSFFGSRSIGSRIKVATSPKRGITMPESGSGNFSAIPNYSSGCRLEQPVQLGSGEPRLAQDRPQGAALQIAVVKWDGDQNARLVWVPEVMVAAADVVHKKASSFQGADQLARPDSRQVAHASSMATSITSPGASLGEVGCSTGIGWPSLVSTSR